ncbi:MAG TPA: murein biosynthesis integral membrane protein MurJ, partial [Aggregatilineaceae bacterium]|nr:murein biosynthesis integral membrane protein MurJ [Aggregatilineaceae bacterium]
MARNTIILMVAFATAKAISLAQTFIIASVFGVGDEWDAFVTANRIPEQIVLLIGGGALSYAFIPIFSSFLARQDRFGAWQLASSVINTVFLVTFGLSVIGFVLAPWLVRHIVAPGFTPDKVAQTVKLMRILLISTLIFSISGIFQGILHSHNHFLLPALAPILFDLGILFGAAFLIGPLGVYGIAWGAVLGAGMHFSIQVPGLIRYRMRWMPRLGWRDPALRRVIVLMIPRVAGLGVVAFNTLVFNNIASRMGSGAVSAFDWGYRLMNIPETLVGSAMGFVVFPTLAAFSELGDDLRKRSAMSGALRFILIATIPAATGLILIGRPLISLLERGAFSAEAGALVYGALQFFAFGLIFQSLHEVIARSFYADKDTLTPLWTALIAAAANVLIVGGLYLGYIHRFDSTVRATFTAWGEQYVSGDYNAALGALTDGTLKHNDQLAGVTGVGGLAIGYSCTFLIELVLLLVILRRRWGSIDERTLGLTAVRTVAASAVMGTAVLLADAGLGVMGWHNAGVILTALRVMGLAGVGAVTFVVAGTMLGLREIRTLPGLILRRRKPPALQ